MPKRKPAPKPRRVGGGVRYHAGRSRPWEAVPSVAGPNGLRAPAKYFATEEEADSYLRELHALHTLGQLTVEATVTLPMFVEGAWLPAVRQGSYKPHTIARYETLWHTVERSPLSLKRDFRSLTVQDMRQLEAWLIANYSRSMIDGVMWLVGTVYNFAISRELATKNPVAILHKSKLGRPKLPEKGQRTAKWTTAQLGTFVSAIEGEPDEAFWLLLAIRLLRQAEGRSLLWENWHVADGSMHVATSLTYRNATSWERTTTKSTQGDRHVSVNPRMAAALLRRQKQSRWVGLDDFIFTTPAGNPWSPDKPVEDLKAWCKRLGLPIITPHFFRHIGNTIWDGIGVPENVRHEASGHTAEMNRQYTHVVDTRIQAAYDDLDRVLGLAEKK